MRRIVMFNHVSTDGYFTTPDGSLDWVVSDDSLSEAAMHQVASFDTVLFGRKTYDLFEQFWPRALDDSGTTAPDPHAPGRRSERVREMAVFLNDADKIVFSRTRRHVTWRNSRLLRDLDPRAVEDMKGQRGGDMLVFGSGSVVSALTRHGLIDEYQFGVVPVVLGAGRPLFADVGRVMLELIDARGFESGNVLQRYRRAQ